NRDIEKDPAFTLRVRGDEFAFCEKPATKAFPPGEIPEVPFTYGPVENEFQELVREAPPSWVANGTKTPKRQSPPPPLKGTRKLAVREQARLQTFPDWFEFVGTPYKQGFQIGNAVPPLFARQLFKVVMNRS